MACDMLLLFPHKQAVWVITERDGRSIRLKLTGRDRHERWLPHRRGCQGAEQQYKTLHTYTHICDTQV